jgi:hypothetical protein
MLWCLWYGRGTQRRGRRCRCGRGRGGEWRRISDAEEADPVAATDDDGGGDAGLL